MNDWVKYASDTVVVGSNWKDNELEKFLLGQSKRKAHDDGMVKARQEMKKQVG